MKRKFLFFLVLAALIFYIGKLSELFLNQSSYIFRPTYPWTSTPEALGLPYEEVSFFAADGTKLSGWFIPAPEATRAVLFCHGNSNNMSADLDAIKVFHGLGLHALVFDYRGYGKSEGTPDEEGTYADAEAAWKYLTETRKTDPKDILIWGRSLGAAIAAELALRHAPRALILEAAFTSLKDLAAQMYPHFPVKWLLRSQYDTAAKLSRLAGCPVLIVHSREDEVVPFDQGERVYQAARDPKHFLEIKGPHRGLPYQPGYEEGLRRFLLVVDAPPGRGLE